MTQISQIFLFLLYVLSVNLCASSAKLCVISQETSWATPTTMNEILQRIYAN
jgi:hypothetical protein